jgi:hypothetical protein
MRSGEWRIVDAGSNEFEIRVGAVTTTPWHPLLCPGMGRLYYWLMSVNVS